jgi:hypothetical protein
MQLEDVSLFGRRLFWNARKGEVESAGSIQLPFGAINKVGNLRFDLDGPDSEIRRLVVSRPPNGDHVILYPIPTFVRELSTAGFGRFKVNVFVITAHHERSQALQVIERCHYLEPPLRGMIVACKFVDQNTQREIRKKARATDFIDPWSEAWHDKPGGIVGCAVLDTLYHGNPLGRREIPEISKTDLRSLLRSAGADELIWSQISRVKLLERFRISWASRFAVDAPYRGLGLSTLAWILFYRFDPTRSSFPWRQEALPASPKTPGLLCVALRPRADFHARPLRRFRVAPASQTTKAPPFNFLSRLYHTALQLAAYA